jgi:hypothetical protein
MATQQSRINTAADPVQTPSGVNRRLDGAAVRTDGPPHTAASSAEPAMTDLIKQLASEGGDLVRNELALAKLEMRDMARELASDSAKVGTAIGLALAGALVLLAAAVLGLGALLGGAAGHYALSALIIGGVMLLVGGLMARSGVAGLKNPPRPHHTVESMQTTKNWASREAREFKEEIRTS